VVYGSASFAQHVRDSGYLNKAMEFTDCVLRKAEPPFLTVPSAAITGLCTAIAQNLGGNIESSLAGKLVDFAKGSAEASVAVALRGDLSFLCNRSIGNNSNSKRLLKVLQKKALPCLRAMVAVCANALVPQLYLSDKQELKTLFCTPGSDSSTTLTSLLGSADVTARKCAAKAVQSCVARLELKPFELPVLPEMNNSVCNFGDMLDDKTCSDITFAVGGRTIHAHKVVLLSSRATTVFSRLLAHGVGAESGASIEIKDTTFASFELLLRFLYTGELKISDAEACDDAAVQEGSDEESPLEQLAQLAERYMVVPLQLRVARLMSLPLLKKAKDSSEVEPLLNTAWKNLALSSTFQSAETAEDTQAAGLLLPSEILQSAAVHAVVDHLEHAVQAQYYDENREQLAGFLVDQLGKYTQ